jgi:proteasome lid subunit RPN8/RPN11
MTLLIQPRRTVRLPGRIPKRQNRRMASPALLRFSSYAWAKLVFLRDLGPTEIGGFGITTPEDCLLVEDICLVRQRATGVTVRFDDQAVADFFDRQVDLGRMPAQFARIWIHSHPGNSPIPSMTDEATFERCFGQADWSIMFILACGGKTYARLHFRAGPGGDLVIPRNRFLAAIRRSCARSMGSRIRRQRRVGRRPSTITARYGRPATP